MTSKRWLSEPVLAGILGIALHLVWVLYYSWQLAGTGFPPYGSVLDFVLRLLWSILLIAVPTGLWVGLAIVGCRLVRNRGFALRLIMGWLAAVVICLPVAIFAFVSLAANDGWRGLAIISLLIPLAIPFVVAALHCVAAVIITIWAARRVTWVEG